VGAHARVSIDDEVGRRRSFACPQRTGDIEGVDLAYLNPDDLDDRRVLILADHPELRAAVENEIREVKLQGQIVNPELHITLHEVAANQLWNDDPPEAWRTAQRLLRMGYDRHEVLHMLTWVVSERLWHALREHRPIDPERYDAALRQLPESWEAERPAAAPKGKQPRRRATARPKRRRHGR
jgi:hypothetical protein